MTATPSPKVCVLLSIYNGARFLKAQIESIAAQKNVSVFILARDDGSSDDSAVIFEETCRGLNIPSRLSKGPNLGAARCFLELIYQAEREFDCYALADQDDVWLEDKLDRAAQALGRNPAKPGLYICRQYITDADLNIIGLSRIPDRLGFGNAVVQNVAVGAACVFNLEALKVLTSIPSPQTLVMHDWWIYLVLSSCGEVTYDPRPGVYYRQHGGNVVGSETRFFVRWKKRIANHCTRRAATCSEQARELLRLAGPQLTPADRRLAQELVDAKSSSLARIRLAFSRSFWRQGVVDDLIWRVLILLGRY